jgi:hypothetical protein
MMDIWGRKPLFTFTLLLSGIAGAMKETPRRIKNGHVVFKMKYPRIS